ncbi:hypothetical protein XELAEV_18008571mg [Xenopus laevis]|uniref:C-type lectin domain-containing protein n=1 Tax=Xenopus laevis TaxID=8355 RepID=A0A974I623_XENLA|nr:hypothetical protein XELAEV_18008571mg [Xenopus laevis]
MNVTYAQVKHLAPESERIHFCAPRTTGSNAPGNSGRGAQPKQAPVCSRSRSLLLSLTLVLLILCAVIMWLGMNCSGLAQNTTALEQMPLALNQSKNPDPDPKISGRRCPAEEKVDCMMKIVFRGFELRATCPYRWLLVHGNCYFFSEDKKTWAESEMFCGSKGANLSMVKAQDDILSNFFVVKDTANSSVIVDGVSVGREVQGTDFYLHYGNSKLTLSSRPASTTALLHRGHVDPVFVSSQSNKLHFGPLSGPARKYRFTGRLNDTGSGSFQFYNKVIPVVHLNIFVVMSTIFVSHGFVAKFCISAFAIFFKKL